MSTVENMLDKMHEKVDGAKNHTLVATMLEPMLEKVDGEQHHTLKHVSTPSCSRLMPYTCSTTACMHCCQINYPRTNDSQCISNTTNGCQQ
jgi:hypothetical protein